MTYRTAVVKRNIELIGMFPFVLLGKIAGRLFPLKTKHHIFLFFPSADIGGSVKVNIDITNCIKDQRPLIIFSKTPKNNQFRSFFELEGFRIIDLHKYIKQERLRVVVDEILQEVVVELKISGFGGDMTINFVPADFQLGENVDVDSFKVFGFGIF